AKEVPFAENDSFYALYYEGRVSMWHRSGQGVPELVGSEVKDSTYTEGYSGFDGNGSNPKFVDFSTNNILNIGGIGHIFLSETDGDGGSVAPYISSWDDSTSLSRGTLTLRKANSPGTFGTFQVTGAVEDKGSWDSVPVKPIASGGVFSNEDAI